MRLSHFLPNALKIKSLLYTAKGAAAIASFFSRIHIKAQAAHITASVDAGRAKLRIKPKGVVLVSPDFQRSEETSRGQAQDPNTPKRVVEFSASGREVREII